MTHYIDRIQTRIAIQDVARKSDYEIELFAAVLGKFAALVLWRLYVEVGVDIDATRSIHDLDADGTGIQRHLAVPVALPRVPGATLLVHQLVYSQASARIGRVAELRHQIVCADRDLIALCQQAHRFGKVLTREMNDEMIDAAAMDLRGRVNEGQRPTGCQRTQACTCKTDP